MPTARFYAKFLAFVAICSIRKLVGKFVVPVPIVTFYPKETNCTQMASTFSELTEKVAICIMLPFVT